MPRPAPFARAFWEAPSGSPRIIGHRGARGDAPENTLGAFEHAVSLGVSAVELDVRACASGEIVVLHDPTLDRLTESRDARRVADLPYRELAQVRLSRGERVPLLAEVLAMLRPRGIGVNVEMKHDVPDPEACVRGLSALLGAWDPGHPILVSSFDPRMLRSLSRLAPDVPRALLVHRSRYYFAMLELAGAAARSTPRPIRCDAIHLDRTIATPRRIQALRARGLRVAVWTVNDREEGARLAKMGVSGIITDVPGVFV